MDIEFQKKKHTYFNMRLDLLISLFIVVVTLTVYWQIRHHEFISFDDGAYVYDNLNVKAGLIFKSIKWAFSFTDIAYWHPLTWLSHMLDCQLFGLNPGMHYMINLIIHITNSILLFLIFKQMNGTL